MDHRVFISYSTQDEPIAEQVYGRLKRKGIPCWMLSKDVQPGADYQAEVYEAIRQAEVVLLIFSGFANESREVSRELALASAKLLIPVRIEDVMPSDAFAYQISNRRFFDVFEDFDRKLEDLANHVVGMLNRGKQAGEAGYIEPIQEKPRRLPFGSSRPSGVKARISSVAISLVAVLLGASAYWLIRKPPQEAGTSATAVSSAAESPSAVAKVIAVMNQGKDDHDRLQRFETVRGQLPGALTVKDIQGIIGGSQFYSIKYVNELMAKIPGDLTGDDLLAMTQGISGPQYVEVIEALIRGGKVKKGIRANELMLLLERSWVSSGQLVMALAPYVDLVSAHDVMEIVRRTNEGDRAQVLTALVGQKKVLEPFTPAQAAELTQLTGMPALDSTLRSANLIQEGGP